MSSYKLCACFLNPENHWLCVNYREAGGCCPFIFFIENTFRLLKVNWLMSRMCINTQAVTAKKKNTPTIIPNIFQRVVWDGSRNQPYCILVCHSRIFPNGSVGWWLEIFRYCCPPSSMQQKKQNCNFAFIQSARKFRSSLEVTK